MSLLTVSLSGLLGAALSVRTVSRRPKSGVSKCEARRIPFPHAYPASSQASCLFTQGARISITCALVADPSIRLSLSVCDLFS